MHVTNLVGAIQANSSPFNPPFFPSRGLSRESEEPAHPLPNIFDAIYTVKQPSVFITSEGSSEKQEKTVQKQTQTRN